MPQDPYANRFFMNGDEWGLYDVLPSENLAHCRRVAEEFRVHHKDTDFTSLRGWTTSPYVIPAPPFPISVRQILLDDLEKILGRVMPRAQAVDSCVDFTGDPYPCPDCFAFALPGGNYWNRDGLYGRQSEGIVQSLHATQFTVARANLAETVDALTELGRRFDLFLFVGANHIIDLREPNEVIAFIDVDDDSENA